MKRTQATDKNGKIAGLYIDERGTFWVRPWVNRKRTWRTLKAESVRAAKAEAHALSTDHGRSKVGLAKNPFERHNYSFSDLADAYTRAGCPDRKLQKRNDAFCESEKTKLEWLKKFFGDYAPDKIRLKLLPGYHDWRVKQISRENCDGARTVDLELVTLSNCINYGVMTEHCEINYVRSGRPKFRRDEDVTHCREVAPESADEVHRIADYFFQFKASEVSGWLVLFTAMSGCRISELLRLQTDPKTPDAPGFIDWPKEEVKLGYLFLGRRSKRGVNPFVLMGPEFQEMLKAFLAWHKEKFPDSKQFFPTGKSTLTHAMKRPIRDLQLPHRKVHGFRSFYVTKRRSDGASDEQIAAEIGDKDTKQISKTYGDRPPNWSGGKNIEWLPADGKPAWSRWSPVKSPLEFKTGTSGLNLTVGEEVTKAAA